jgi:hypothetical protein
VRAKHDKLTRGNNGPERRIDAEVDTWILRREAGEVGLYQCGSAPFRRGGR